MPSTPVGDPSDRTAVLEPPCREPQARPADADREIEKRKRQEPSSGERGRHKLFVSEASDANRETEKRKRQEPSSGGRGRHKHVVGEEAVDPQTLTDGALVRAPKRDAADDDEMQSLVIIKKTGRRWLARSTDTPAAKIPVVKHNKRGWIIRLPKDIIRHRDAPKAGFTTESRFFTIGAKGEDAAKAEARAEAERWEQKIDEVINSVVLANDDDTDAEGVIYSLNRARTLAPHSVEAHAARLAASQNAGKADAKRKAKKSNIQNTIQKEVKKEHGKEGGGGGARRKSARKSAA